MASLLTSLRLALITLAVCAGGYTAVILGFAQVVAPATANGSLIAKPDGTLVGSRLIAQAFTQPRWFWPRPSAVGYDAAAAGGSNKSPTSADLTARARATIAAFGASSEQPLPADLAAASGSGLDPHISAAAARWQIARVAAARGLPPERVASLVERLAFTPGAFSGRAQIVNVLELNLAVDAAR